MSKKDLAMWILMVLVALWIVSLPALCKAYDPDLAGISTNLTYISEYKSGPRPWTKGEKTVLAWSVGAVVADMFTTCRMLDNPYNYEMNPVLGKHPSDGKVVAVLSLSHIVCVAISHWVPEIDLPIIGKVNMRYSLLGSKAALNTYYSINNAQLDWD